MLDNISIDPFGTFYYNWLLISTICYIYNAIFLIARSSFWLLQDQSLVIYWYIIDYFICDLIFIFDIVVRLNTSFMLNGELCTDKTKIKQKYMLIEFRN